MHPVEDISGSGDNLDCRRVELSTNVTLARSRWATGSSDQLERRCWNENHVPAEAGPPRPQLSSPGERERNTAMARRVGGLYVAVLRVGVSLTVLSDLSK